MCCISSSIFSPVHLVLFRLTEHVLQNHLKESQRMRPIGWESQDKHSIGWLRQGQAPDWPRAARGYTRLAVETCSLELNQENALIKLMPPAQSLIGRGR